MMVAFVLAALQGCVAMSQYEKVEKENQHLHERIDRLDARIERQVKEIKELREDLKPLIDRGVVTLEVVDGRVVVGMRSDVLFPSGSADLSEEGKQTVAQLARVLTRRVGDSDFQVEGHTDNEPIATSQFPNNWYLGAARGITVAEYMVSQGFPKDRISAATFADTSPVATNGNEAGRAQNRRIEVVLVPDLSDMPGAKRLMEAGAPGRSKRKK